LALGAALSLLVVSADTQGPRFVDVARHAGVAFDHTNGASPDKHLVETMGSGGLFFDYDNDGWIDIFLVDGGSVADPAAARRARHRLFRNRGNGTFEDVTERSRIMHRDYGMGACAGDYDGDGRTDLYVTNLGANSLYRNTGNGVFADVTGTARVGDSRWSASCAFADLDRDGDLDLWVTNYVEIRLKPDSTTERKPDSTINQVRNPFCGDAKAGPRFYCHPLKYDPLPNTLYRNNGNGTFTDVSAASGVGALRSNGMGVVVADFNEDGWPDVFVSNDSLPNFLFRNDKGLRFTETALAAGVAVATDGMPRAGMGIDTGDYDADGHLDLVVTNLDFQTHTLHRGLGKGLFGNATVESGIGYPTLPFVGFGVAFLDFDNDTQLDIVIVNGHVLDNAPQYRAGSTYQQRKLLFRNTSLRRFSEIGRSMGAAFTAEKVGRGLATGDIDNDGDLDLLVTNNGQPAELLRNEGSGGNALLIQLRGPRGSVEAIGARIRVTAGGRTQLRDIKAGSSYLSQSDLRAHVGLGAATTVERIDIQWPTGERETITGVAANQTVTIAQGEGVVERRAFAGKR
jgi:hypothetical protein